MGVAGIAAQYDWLDLTTLTAKPGVIGGLPAGGMNFGATSNAEAVLDQPAQLYFYDGVGLDVAFLGLAQADAQGYVNVSQFGGQLVGAGGFIDISQDTWRLVLAGTFCAGHLDAQVQGGKLVIGCGGDIRKFVAAVGQITLNGIVARMRQQAALCVTERCAVRLANSGL